MFYVLSFDKMKKKQKKNCSCLLNNFQVILLNCYICFSEKLTTKTQHNYAVIIYFISLFPIYISISFEFQ